MKRKKFLESLNDRKTFELADPVKIDPATIKETDLVELCQACSHVYSNDNITIVDDVGPVCINCMCDATNFLFNGSVYKDIDSV